MAIVLDERSRKKLERRCNRQTVYCHHVTMVYKPTPSQWQKYCHLIDERIEFVAVGIAEDQRCQAVLVENVPSENKYPHVTIGCNPGTEPVYSNEMLRRAKGQGRIKRCRIKLSGTVQFIRL